MRSQRGREDRGMHCRLTRTRISTNGDFVVPVIVRLVLLQALQVQIDLRRASWSVIRLFGAK